jgi:hypothetical protein
MVGENKAMSSKKTNERRSILSMEATVRGFIFPAFTMNRLHVAKYLITPSAKPSTNVRPSNQEDNSG